MTTACCDFVDDRHRQRRVEALLRHTASAVAALPGVRRDMPEPEQVDPVACRLAAGPGMTMPGLSAGRCTPCSDGRREYPDRRTAWPAARTLAEMPGRCGAWKRLPRLSGGRSAATRPSFSDVGGIQRLVERLVERPWPRPPRHATRSDALQPGSAV